MVHNKIKFYFFAVKCNDAKNIKLLLESTHVSC